MKFFSFRPNTDRAIAGFSKALDQLDAVVEAEANKLRKIAGKIDNLRDQQDAAITRKVRAEKISRRLAGLLAD